MRVLDSMNLDDYIIFLMEKVRENELLAPFAASTTMIELHWDWYNWYEYIGEERYTKVHLMLSNAGHRFDNYKA
jgi:hypothetical protein